MKELSLMSTESDGVNMIVSLIQGRLREVQHELEEHKAALRERSKVGEKGGWKGERGCEQDQH